MKGLDSFDSRSHDPDDPDPWMALYLDQSTPLGDETKRLWLLNVQSPCRQFVLPLVRPVARLFVVAIQAIKTVTPRRLSASSVLHKVVRWGLSWFVSPSANLLILRHFHVGSEILDFIARNVPAADLPLDPLRPRTLAALEDHLFVRHDLNLFNFVIRLGRQVREGSARIERSPWPDFDGITDGPFDIDPMPDRWTNALDLETAIEMFTPIYQLLLTDTAFWRASNSLQLDETIGLYAATILGTPEHLILVNNKHPLVPESTLRAGHRLVLHGLAAEMLHAILRAKKREQAAVARIRDEALGFAPPVDLAEEVSAHVERGTQNDQAEDPDHGTRGGHVEEQHLGGRHGEDEQRRTSQDPVASGPSPQ